jgi:hypothetical protein
MHHKPQTKWLRRTLATPVPIDWSLLVFWPWRPHLLLLHALAGGEIMALRTAYASTFFYEIV